MKAGRGSVLEGTLLIDFQKLKLFFQKKLPLAHALIALNATQKDSLSLTTSKINCVTRAPHEKKIKKKIDWKIHFLKGFSVTHDE